MLVSLVLLVIISLLFQFQSSAVPVPVAMQAARSDQAGAAESTSQPMIIQWGNGGMGGGGDGEGNVAPQAANPPAGAYGMGGGQPQETQTNSMMKVQPTSEVGFEAAPAATEAPIAKLAEPNAGLPPEAPGPTPQPTPAVMPKVPAVVENTPVAGPVAQEKQVPNQAEAPVKILGIAPTQEQGLIQSTPPIVENYPASATPVSILPFIQAGLVFLAVSAGALAFFLRKKALF